MSDDGAPAEEVEEGAPAWLATFADLMSLLMCFFVLLLSFSEMDIQKYKQVAGSMTDAFGVQRKIKADEIPKGTSVIAQEFSPGKPEPTVMESINQKTSDDTKNYVQTKSLLPVDVQDLVEKAETILSAELESDVVDLLPYDTGLLLRINEQNSFPSGSAILHSEFKLILNKVVTLLSESEGSVVVAGHTDNIPISNYKYPSNWVLSSDRAASVVHFMVTRELKFSNRIEIRGHADTLPVVDNESATNRALNRRIEINIAVESEET